MPLLQNAGELYETEHDRTIYCFLERTPLKILQGRDDGMRYGCLHIIKQCKTRRDCTGQYIAPFYLVSSSLLCRITERYCKKHKLA